MRENTLKKTLKNAKEWPKKYSFKFIEPGIVSYKDVEGETVLLRKETIDKMLPSFIGKPIIIDHNDVNPDNLEDYQEGLITDVRYNPEDNWYYADGIIYTDEGKQIAEDKNYSISCAYQPTQFGKGGSYHATEYDSEVLDGEFTHLALVDNPRYEDAKILFNSKKGETKMFFTNKKKEVKNEKEIDYSNSFVNMGEEEVSMQELVDAYKMQKEEEEKNKKNELSEEDMIEIEGVEVPVKELMDAYKNKCENQTKTNKEDYDEEQGEVPGEQDTGPDEYKDEKDEKAKENEVKNSKSFSIKKAKAKESFDNLKKAHENSGETEIKNSIVTREDRLAEGKKRYSLNNKKGE